MHDNASPADCHAFSIVKNFGDSNNKLNSNVAWNNPFRPPWYLRNGHVQTILTSIHRPKAEVSVAEPTSVEVGPRGSTYIYRNVPLAYSHRNLGDDHAFVLLHGLGSSHSGSYMTGVCAALLDAGFQTIRIDTPGAGQSHHLTDLPPHAGSSASILKVLKWIHQNWNVRRFRLVGFSLGGNISLHLAAHFANELADQSNAGNFQIDSIHALAPPIDLASCCENMERGINRMYAKFFLRGLRRAALARAQVWASWQQHVSGFGAQTIRAFDDDVTAPLAGFKDAMEYYEYSSVHRRLHEIAVPTTIVADKHDPIVPAWMFDKLDPSSLPNIRVIETEYGGHLGYYQHAAGKGLSRWADSAFSNLLIQSATDATA